MSPIPENIPTNIILITAMNACTPSMIYNALLRSLALSLGGTRLPIKSRPSSFSSKARHIFIDIYLLIYVYLLLPLIHIFN